MLSPKSSSPSSSSISASRSSRRPPSFSNGAKSGPGDDTFDRGVAAGEFSGFKKQREELNKKINEYANYIYPIRHI